ncbi:Endonuclease/Exonuclease/phosphatase family protein [Tritrichomonas foetus]|uniref:sphingomyelin phosphodiesterase n=1 Tax=Tritrichomonas foetus TaxID=1144522 RepID=A0A1J4KLU5_9EUKA|nr:Endonuclease/Exonuclease/phosphatase family protein [Tritrichomonas foetus]|eukprot:OHT12273.1 Endonuclease/Exonuclease/phosphatase family protein [Tritrichomonas foetus]
MIMDEQTIEELIIGDEYQSKTIQKKQLLQKLLRIAIIILVVSVGIVLIAFSVFKIILSRTLDLSQYSISIQSEFKIPESTKRLKILQYNAFWRSDIMHIGTNEYVHERAMTLVDLLDDYDIVCLSETFQFGSSTVQHFIESMKAKGFNYFASGEKPSFFSRFLIDSGCMICSKYPIIEIDTFTYPDGQSFDAFCAKAIIYTKIQISQTQTVNLFSTHLQASYDIITESDLKIRSKQRGNINNFMKKQLLKTNSSQNELLLLVGDLNSEFYDLRERKQFLPDLQIEGYEIADTLYDSSSDKRPFTTCDQFFTNGPDIKRESIDYCLIYQLKGTPHVESYHSNVVQFAVPKRPYQYLSDHFAVTADLILQ